MGVLSCSQRRWFRSFLVLILATGLTGCGLLGRLFKRDGRKPAKGSEQVGKGMKEPSMRSVGEIASVHTGEGFVLIRRFAQGRFGTGDLVASFNPDGTTSSLRLTGERLGRFNAADIQEGTPRKGDVVILRRLPEGSKVPSTPRPDPPEPTSRVPKPGLEAPGEKNSGARIVKNTVIPGV